MADDLDEHLIPKNSPYNSREPYVTAYDFDVTHQIPAGGINYTNLTAASRAATAVISLSGEKGTFKDIQAAINYVNSLGGGRILVLPGTYTITQALILYSDIVLEGLSPADCIFDFNSTTFNLSTVASASDVSIKNLTLKNCFNAVTATIYLNTVTRVQIDHCIFNGNVDGSGAGGDIYVQASRFVDVKFCASTSSGVFYYADSSAGINQVSFNDVISPVGYAIQGGTTVSGGGQTRYQNNNIRNMVKAAFTGRFNVATINGNLVSSLSSITEPVINLGTTGNCQISGNQVFGNTTSVVTLTDCSRCFFTGNSLIGTGSSVDGLRLVTSDFCTVTGNTIESGTTGGTAYGVNIGAGCDRTVVVGNHLNGLTADTLDSGASSVIDHNS